MIIALVGRRIDPSGAEPARFPPENVGRVRDRLRRLFRTTGATALIGSGACGADLLAMDVAGELGLRRRMVLPFAPGRFRATSVDDRLGDWGPTFDRLAAGLDAAGDLVVLGCEGEPEDAYAAVNAAILDEAQRLARAGSGDDRKSCGGVLAVVAWDGHPRGPDDLTAAFAREARGRGLALAQVSTLDHDPAHGEDPDTGTSLKQPRAFS